MNTLFKTFIVFTFSMGLSVGSAHAEKWLGNGIICQNYEDTFSMAVESNLASSDLAALKVYLKYISSKKCTMHKICEKVVYKGRGSKELFDKLRKEGKGDVIETAKLVPISGIQLPGNGKTYYVQDDYLTMSKSKCK